MPRIHPTAIIDPKAELSEDVEIGPYVVIEGDVHIGAGTVLLSHTVVTGITRIGRACRIGPASVIGTPPNHAGYKGEATAAVIGDRVTIREHCTVHRAMKPGLENATRIGNDTWMMAGAHAGHDAQVGNNVTMANGVLLGGHVQIADRAFLGGGSVYHQFMRVGRLAIVRGNEGLSKDIPPYAAAAFGYLRGYNAVGCRRAGLSQQAVHSIRQVYLCFKRHRVTRDALAAVALIQPRTEQIDEIVAFYTSTKRGIQPHSGQMNRSIEPAVENE